MMKSIAFTAFAIAFAVSGAAFAADPAAMAPTAKNGMFVDAKGMTLYTFDKDTAGKILGAIQQYGVNIPQAKKALCKGKH